jgi:ATP-dependent DNA helicase PIF1
LIKSNPQHSTAVVAPTGIAAMNVEGQTIHSMFKLPPEIITNGAVRPLIDPDVIRSIDILIIDEISMVRADLFDAIDQSLRLNRKRWNTPFGGVKIVAFGDFYQLPPVVTDQDRDQMRNMGYTTEFFFSSRAFKQALQENQVAYHQFSTIFRQSDQMFIDVLNKVRAYTFDQEVATALNSRVIDQVEHAPKNSTILTTINRVANAHNNRELEKLPGAASSFTAEVTGKIADSEVPAVKELNLKVGAKVLFVKNNIPAWVNGSVGTVVQLPTSEPNESKTPVGPH